MHSEFLIARRRKGASPSLAQKIICDGLKSINTGCYGFKWPQYFELYTLYWIDREGNKSLFSWLNAWMNLRTLYENPSWFNTDTEGKMVLPEEKKNDGKSL